VALGEPFTSEQLGRLERARELAELQTGIQFGVRVGAVDGDVKREAERMLANVVTAPREPAVLVLVSPGQRFVHIMTTPGAKRRISDGAAGLVALTMTSSFALGDLVGGLVNGLRQLADAAGSPAGRPAEQAATKVETAESAAGH
jgi:uncharacterized membrane protein YgcG